MLSYDWRHPERVVPWKPRHRFRVTEAGRSAFDDYSRVLKLAQDASNPREALDGAKTAWAEPFKLRTSDGIVLEDLVSGRTCLADIAETLAACDLTLREARGAIDRLLAASLIESVDPLPGS
ncbi:MAG: hypothetical protein HOP12_09650 [Candidatus Eisenbacteria bacterium]|uniref:PqqD family protein n=1 Tax=Eiseniibacteriota bacterium TaxID=2212470 RepID=A0A849SSR3_UNCEI|nr:hypothetical protein [Candidatus Eisenbacteria bacterium]